MKNLNEVGRSTRIPVESNNGGIILEGMVMFVQSVVNKWDLMARFIRILLKSNSKWDQNGRWSLLSKCNDTWNVQFH
jgi:hypothetical protein